MFLSALQAGNLASAGHARRLPYFVTLTSIGELNPCANSSTHLVHASALLNGPNFSQQKPAHHDTLPSAGTLASISTFSLSSVCLSSCFGSTMIARPWLPAFFSIFS